jgi:signal peptidase I
MADTIVRGDRVVADMRYYRNTAAAPGDLVLFRRDGQYLIKRVIGVGGNTVRGEDRQLFIDGNLLDEPYVRHVHKGPIPKLDTFGPVSVPAGKLFVVGDNRDESYDSRLPEFGLVDVSDVVGRPLFIVDSEKDRTGTNIQ